MTKTLPEPIDFSKLVLPEKITKAENPLLLALCAQLPRNSELRRVLLKCPKDQEFSEDYFHLGTNFSDFLGGAKYSESPIPEEEQLDLKRKSVDLSADRLPLVLKKLVDLNVLNAHKDEEGKVIYLLSQNGLHVRNRIDPY